MKHEKEFRERCAARGLDAQAVDRAVAAAAACEAALGGSDAAPERGAVERHIADLVRRGAASEEALMALARYFAIGGETALATRILAYLLPVGVLPAMAERLEKLEGAAARERVMAGVAVPPVGAPPEAYPAGTAAFVVALERELGPERAARVLRWNVHGIPESAYASERAAFLESPSIEAWLEAFHARKVSELQRHADDGTLWFEQRITQRVVDWVRDSPEVLGAVRDGDTLYATKIPYDPDRWLTTTDLLEKRRLACHCPLAASTIVAGGAGVDSLWCACSAGYEKFLFDVVFAENTEVEVRESVLAGEGRCRFAVKIPESILRREKEKHAGPA